MSSPSMHSTDDIPGGGSSFPADASRRPPNSVLSTPFRQYRGNNVQPGGSSSSSSSSNIGSGGTITDTSRQSSSSSSGSSSGGSSSSNFPLSTSGVRSKRARDIALEFSRSTVDHLDRDPAQNPNFNVNANVNDNNNNGSDATPKGKSSTLLSQSTSPSSSSPSSSSSSPFIRPSLPVRYTTSSTSSSVSAAGTSSRPHMSPRTSTSAVTSMNMNDGITGGDGNGSGSGSGNAPFSPWHHLMATSGAPTPSLEHPGSSSGHPFSFGNLGTAENGNGNGGVDDPGFFFGASNADMASGRPGPGPVPGHEHEHGHGNRMGSGGEENDLQTPTTRTASGTVTAMEMVPGKSTSTSTSTGQAIANPFSASNHSPHLGGPFEKLNIGGGLSTAQTSGRGSSTMGGGDPFSFLPSSQAGSLLAKRWGSGSKKSGSAGLSGGAHANPTNAFGTTPLDSNGQPKESAVASSSSSNSLGPTHSATSGHGLFSPGTTCSSSRAPSSSSPGVPSQPNTPASPAPLTPAGLSKLLAESADSILLLDLRPPSSFVQGHIPHSLSLPIPSTLLKRATFSLQKLAEMLPPKPMFEIIHFEDKRNVVIIDQDSSHAPSNSVLTGLAAKFHNASHRFQGKVWFLKGGIAEGQRQEGLPLVVGDEDEEGDNDVDADIEMQGVEQTQSRSAPIESPNAAQQHASAARTTGRMVGGLDRLAFSSASAQGMGAKRKGPGKLTLPPNPGLSLFGRSRGGAGVQPDPFRLDPSADANTSQRKGLETAPIQPSQSPSGALEDETCKTLQPANPFFDNIRQNLELSHGGITERIPLVLPEEVKRRAGELPAFLRNLVDESPEQVASRLAHEFESVERDEQRRLQGIMDWHARGSRQWCKDDQLKMEEDFCHDRKSHGSRDIEYFPFSITAGVERGSKNRYKNIWPYDFSRVRLHERCEDDGSDYVNANFVRPPGSSKRYIATQGPMEATFRDFWTLVWEQQVNVIVMLTKQFEGGSIKCGTYWTDGQYGPLRLELIATEGEKEGSHPVGAADFGFPTIDDNNGSASSETSNIKRVFELSHADYPDVAPRKLVQIQCVSWPDFDVPDDPRVLLNLCKEVDATVDELSADSDGQKPPVLVHCSAGIGRTGSFIVVDAVLEGLRREYQLKSRKISGSHAKIQDGRRGSVSTPTSGDTPSSSLYIDKRTSSPLRQSVTPEAIESPPQTDIESNLGFIDLVTDMNRAAQFAPDRERSRDPTPISAMPAPVKSTLAGIRMQRMSLCQSLRQYLFVYRSIIIGYLDMIDEEREHGESARHSLFHTSNSSNTNPNSGPNTDDETHSKRRASPTQLGGASLTKRPSIKIRKSNSSFRTRSRQGDHHEDGTSVEDSHSRIDIVTETSK